VGGHRDRGSELSFIGYGSYSRNVELSRRIQQHQLSNILGVPVSFFRSTNANTNSRYQSTDTASSVSTLAAEASTNYNSRIYNQNIVLTTADEFTGNNASTDTRRANSVTGRGNIAGAQLPVSDNSTMSLSLSVSQSFENLQKLVVSNEDSSSSPVHLLFPSPPPSQSPIRTLNDGYRNGMRHRVFHRKEELTEANSQIQRLSEAKKFDFPNLFQNSKVPIKKISQSNSFQNLITESSDFAMFGVNLLDDDYSDFEETK